MSENGYIRGFHWSNKAWYAKANQIDKGLIRFGIYATEGGTTGEMSMEWVEIAGELVPCLQIYNDAWANLAEFKDLIDELARVNDKNITDEQFVGILLKCQFADLTHYNDPDSIEGDSLKPCPFCGCGNIELKKSPYDNVISFWAQCKSCGQHGKHRATMEDAAAFWNRRKGEV